MPYSDASSSKARNLACNLTTALYGDLARYLEGGPLCKLVNVDQGNGHAGDHGKVRAVGNNPSRCTWHTWWRPGKPSSRALIATSRDTSGNTARRGYSSHRVDRSKCPGTAGRARRCRTERCAEMCWHKKMAPRLLCPTGPSGYRKPQEEEEGGTVSMRTVAPDLGRSFGPPRDGRWKLCAHGKRVRLGRAVPFRDGACARKGGERHPVREARARGCPMAWETALEERKEARQGTGREQRRAQKKGKATFAASGDTRRTGARTESSHEFPDAQGIGKVI